jgi:alpha-tubulin suppressor-like RCC1 family protein
LRAAGRVAARACIVALTGALALLATSCLGPGDFRCHAHVDCGSDSFCEIDGRCSVRDPVCASGRRYREHEGASSGACVGATCAGNPIHAMAAGSSHACLLRADGIVSCWGRNDDGELGDGTRTPRSLPAPVVGLGTAKAIATGESHSCAVLEDGAVSCWGADDAGQLGIGVGDSRGGPVAVPGVSGAIAVAAGAAFSCAVLGDGTVRCWGDNSMGQLGDGGDATAGRAATTVFAMTGVRALSAHWQHACALRDDETLWCWGDNSTGQLGDGTFDVRAQPVRALGLGAVTDVGTGRGHTCAATRADGLFCWGNNNVGQLGRDALGPAATPTLVPIVTNPVAVATGAQHTCAIRQGGATLCWGGNTSGQLGDGSLSTVPIPVPVSGLGPMAAIVAGGAFTCGRADDGATFCWGDDRYGELGLGSTTLRTRPTRVATIAGATELAAGAAHTCVVSRDGGPAGATTGHVSCWGANQAGQLGDATMADRARPESIKGEIDATSLAAGLAHTCAVTGDGALWCWGRAGSGQLGPGRNVDTPQPTPVALTAGAVVRGVAAGEAHTCAALANHTALCFGANGDGQLGDGTTKDRATPAAVLDDAGAAALGPVDSVVAGAGHACARLTDGGVRCWGRGAEGQLGDGAAKSAALPVRPMLRNAAPTPGMALAAGAAHTCALDTVGGVWCWGRGAEGQLGVGPLGVGGGATGEPAPVAVAVVASARGLAAGRAHTCALAGDGTVLCWGANAFGELGDGTTTDRSTPAPVVGLDGVEQLAAGDAHTCARRTDGTTWCWGADGSGQLGDDAVLTHNTPQLARLACH